MLMVWPAEKGKSVVQEKSSLRFIEAMKDHSAKGMADLQTLGHNEPYTEALASNPTCRRHGSIYS